jgi:hypothetical protein
MPMLSGNPSTSTPLSAAARSGVILLTTPPAPDSVSAAPANASAGMTKSGATSSPPNAAGQL